MMTSAVLTSHSVMQTFLSQAPFPSAIYFNYSFSPGGPNLNVHTFPATLAILMKNLALAQKKNLQPLNKEFRIAETCGVVPVHFKSGTKYLSSKTMVCFGIHILQNPYPHNLWIQLRLNGLVSVWALDFYNDI